MTTPRFTAHAQCARYDVIPVLQVELFEAETLKKESVPGLRICDFLRSEVCGAQNAGTGWADLGLSLCPQGRGVDFVVLWLDCDKEGENICFEVCRPGRAGCLGNQPHPLSQFVVLPYNPQLNIFTNFTALLKNFNNTSFQLRNYYRNKKKCELFFMNIFVNPLYSIISSPTPLTGYNPVTTSPAPFPACSHVTMGPAPSSLQVLEEVEPVMRAGRSAREQTVFRAHFSSITEAAILQAFHSLGEPNYNEARSVDARQELDLRIGCSFTRFQTTLFQVSAGEVGVAETSYSLFILYSQ